MLTDKQLLRGVHGSTKEPEIAILNYIKRHDHSPKLFNWRETADQILYSVAHLSMQTLKTAHQSIFGM
jgi:hypothetical protein